MLFNTQKSSSVGTWTDSSRNAPTSAATENPPPVAWWSVLRYCSGWDVSFAQPTASDEIEIAGTFTERFCTSKDTQSTVQLRAGELALRFYAAPLSWCDGITVPLKFDAAVGSDASYNLHVYRWNGDYASTVASEPRAEKSGTLDASSSDEQIVTVSTKSADGDAHGFFEKRNIPCGNIGGKHLRYRRGDHRVQKRRRFCGIRRTRKLSTQSAA